MGYLKVDRNCNLLFEQRRDNATLVRPHEAAAPINDGLRGEGRR